ncbi:3-phosphoshikimate 1-carboxyvinyltransferase [Desmospora profundinema]|uniref:3-phosphoshikimate 1-carboxyvinyltransferase n=1 Tax=Desmospora profundinema TaxID=1571184 RepID=A0ABU1II81_9BACL|nr:3-phosphoshikimate 1-carboxyvinyltransferase [Desmospora profundinema]MDR6224490.1 3-phosphoshikimate 1-carboxyvinyltransferase [Desmospora profundinema]
MKTLTIQPADSLRGDVTVPGDKSISHRAVMFGAVARGTTRVEGFLPGADCLSTISCFRRMGVAIEQESETVVTVHGRGWEGLTEPESFLDVGNSGTTIRLMLGILAGLPFYSAVIGDESIARRPMDRVVDPLRQMGAWIEGRKNGSFTPLGIRGGNLEGVEHVSPVASAQVKSCLLLAGLQADGVTRIREPHRSRDHTERMLPAFGVELTREEGGVSLRGGQQLSGRDVRVPGDISSAAFLIAAALIVPGSRVTIRNVGLNPTRTGILDTFREMGGAVEVEETGEWTGEPVGDITVTASSLRGVEVKGDRIPRLIDEIPILAVVATQADGPTVIRDAAELKVKETNRISVTAQELRRLGAVVEETPDGLIIKGRTPLTGDRCDSHGDHRIGMAAAVAGLIADGGVSVSRAGAIDVSFPGFFETLNRLAHR